MKIIKPPDLLKNQEVKVFLSNSVAGNNLDQQINYRERQDGDPITGSRHLPRYNYPHTCHILVQWRSYRFQIHFEYKPPSH